MRAMQRTQCCAKSAKKNLKPTDFSKCNFYFETEGIYVEVVTLVGDIARREVDNMDSRFQKYIG